MPVFLYPRLPRAILFCHGNIRKITVLDLSSVLYKVNARRKRSWILHLTECRVSFATVHCSFSRSRVSARSHGVSLRNRKFIQKFRNYKSVRMFRESEITPPTTVACIKYKVGRRKRRRWRRWNGLLSSCRCQLQITVLKIRPHKNDLTMCKRNDAVKVSPS